MTDGPRFVAAVESPSRFRPAARQRFRTLCAVLRQGFDLCAARDRPAEAPARRARAPARAAAPGIRLRQRRDAARRRADPAPAGQRPDGAHHRRERHGQGPGRARHPRRIAAARQHVPPLQLHERDARAGRQPAVRPPARQFHRRRRRPAGRPADGASAGRCSSTRSAISRSTCSRSCCGSSSRAKCCPSATRGPQRVDVRVVAATNADLEQRVADGKFREDLFYRLSVIRIHVPPLRDRREEIPHLSTFFLREASRTAGKARRPSEPRDARSLRRVHLAGQRPPAPQRGAARRRDGPPGGLITSELLSPVFVASSDMPADGTLRFSGHRTSLASAVESLEREMIEGALERADGNISETARYLGLTRRGLYLKMQRLGVSAARV